MRYRKMKAFIKPIGSLIFAAVLLFSAVMVAFPVQTNANTAQIICNVKFSKPAICCDVGQTIHFDSCGVQFAPDAVMTNSGITWTQNGTVLSTFTPTVRGVYTFTATSGTNSKTVYVVAKNPEETEYVLYRNDFHSAPTDFRIIENSNGASISVSGSNYIMDAFGNKDAYVAES